MALEKFLKRKELVSCALDTSAIDIARIMKDQQVGAVVVLDQGRARGIVTDRDLVTRCISHNFDSGRMQAKDIMSQPIETIFANSGIYQAITQMQNHKIRRMVVVNTAHQPIGILSSNDVLELLSLEIAKLVTALGSDREKTMKDKVA